MPTAELITDGADSPEIEREGALWRGRRVYRVNTHDETIALHAGGLPNEGDAWDGTHPTLRCRRLRARYMYGTNKPETDEGGWSHVTVDYDSGQGTSPLPTPQVGEAYTEFATETGSLPQRFDIQAGIAAGPEDPIGWPIEDGKGIDRRVGALLIRAVTYPVPSSIDFGLISDLIAGQKVNSDEFQLPPLLNTSVRWDVPQGRAQYADCAIELDRNVVRVVHTLRISVAEVLTEFAQAVPAYADHPAAYHLWVRETDNGTIAGSPGNPTSANLRYRASQVYELADFRPLFDPF